VTRAGVWLLRCIGVTALAALVLVGAEAVMAMRAHVWLAVPDLAALEVTVIAALAAAATSAVARGRRAFRLETWTAGRGWRDRFDRVALIWCASFAAALGVKPGLALGLGPPAIWLLALIAVATCVARARGSEAPRRVAWLVCASYGLAASATLIAVRHVF
jgi:hypothetical protein